jgi:hypothetical protein
MPQRNGHKRVESPRPEVRSALRKTIAAHATITEAPHLVSDLVRKHPLATLVVGGLAGLGAIMCIKKILR